MSDIRDQGSSGASVFGRVRTTLDRHSATFARMNQQLSAIAVALAILVTLTVACRAPAFLADHSATTQLLD
jgi:hypothetical protein